MCIRDRYITEDEDKALIRKIAFRMIDEKVEDYKSVIKLVKEEIGGM